MSSMFVSDEGPRDGPAKAKLIRGGERRVPCFSCVEKLVSKPDEFKAFRSKDCFECAEHDQSCHELSKGSAGPCAELYVFWTRGGHWRNPQKWENLMNIAMRERAKEITSVPIVDLVAMTKAISALNETTARLADEIILQRQKLKNLENAQARAVAADCRERAVIKERLGRIQRETASICKQTAGVDDTTGQPALWLSKQKGGSSPGKHGRPAFQPGPFAACPSGPPFGQGTACSAAPGTLAARTAKTPPDGLSVARRRQNPAKHHDAPSPRSPPDALAPGRGAGVGLDGVPPPPAFPRRGSSLSDYSSEARDILNPRPRAAAPEESSSSSLASVSLAFALLPAISGALFKNGHAIVTDVMLLGLAGVFLHWSVTQPWAWYHAAQQVRVQHEDDLDFAVEDEADADAVACDTRHAAALDDVPEESETVSKDTESMAQADPRTARQRAALRELYAHEVLALLACLALPLASAYLLHAIRTQLSRPSEGLVSNYNLTIFLLVSELRVFSHVLKLVQSRTLHLQRVVHENEFTSPSGTAARIEDALARLELLEAHSRNGTAGPGFGSGADPNDDRGKQEAALAREVRNAIQPELDALNRAVRRYEKKATLLQLQTESRFTGLDARLDDAIALAAVAAKNSTAKKNVVRRMAESVTTVVLFPFKAVLQLVLLPLTYLLAVMNRSQRKTQASTRTGRSSRTGKAMVQPRYGTDRVPTRVARR
ncbi:hypothetical protein HIM_06519 [Hirsutella minnesotensis 3608]|uniref:Uncharacterized protein n=1 Tax=Hirsutella minnesotensis 3608 TaxID=1043627 RepID=A0A0F7ZNN7_9HYPO|nr:hypothetical protein HIM_06519 [Hirsutella minnesotensis 3608]